MLRAGDHYIHFTKYGGVNKGIVKRIAYSNIFDGDNKVIYKRPHIITHTGFSLELDGSDGKVYKIEKEITDEQIKYMSKIITASQERKEAHKKDITKRFEKTILPLLKEND